MGLSNVAQQIIGLHTTLQDGKFLTKEMAPILNSSVLTDELAKFEKLGKSKR